jgi:hypothetical protein
MPRPEARLTPGGNGRKMAKGAVPTPFRIKDGRAAIVKTKKQIEV